ncbi:hypothetical protein HPB49_021555 [Dermacentor silvarum]|uniref:Uncharacterized protein n=1 Tax=Dermacentor silvarum TaxID=543639 RepID=A0ACB8CT93_DERSI|nr:hypothetical protein HPB49_021555 [Dermacentor silvarum]
MLGLTLVFDVSHDCMPSNGAFAAFFADPVAAEALHLANLLCQYGYFFPVSDNAKTFAIRDDSTLYRFQEALQRLKKLLYHKWEFICMQAQEQAACEQYQCFDSFIVPPYPGNPWITDDPTLWALESSTAEVPTERRLQRWNLSLEELLADPMGAHEFEQYLRTEYSHENILFWKAVQDLRHGSQQDMPRKVAAIYEEFLCRGAPCEVNLDSETLERTQQEVHERPTRFSLDAAQHHVFALMKKDTYTRFTRSEHFRRLMAKAQALQQAQGQRKRFFHFGSSTKKKTSVCGPLVGTLPPNFGGGAGVTGNSLVNVGASTSAAGVAGVSSGTAGSMLVSGITASATSPTATRPSGRPLSGSTVDLRNTSERRDDVAGAAVGAAGGFSGRHSHSTSDLHKLEAPSSCSPHGHVVARFSWGSREPMDEDADSSTLKVPRWSHRASDPEALLPQLGLHMDNWDLSDKTKATAMPTEASTKMMTSMSTMLGSTLAANRAANKQSEEDTTKITVLTYKMPPSTTIPASSEHDEPETTEEAPTSTARTERISDAYPLLCTYGTKTNTSTLFPDDGLCDFIFYDSAYNHGRNSPTSPASFSESMKAVLAASLRYKTTEIGIAFAFDYMATLRSDMKAGKVLEEFWNWRVYHFGIVDMPAFGIVHKDITEVFVVLKELSALAQQNPGDVELPYIVLGAVPLQLANDYALQMRRGHFAYGDSDLPDCKAVPPTMLTKPPKSPGYPYDLVISLGSDKARCSPFQNGAVNALKQIHDEGGWSKWLLSVGMKGRWTKLGPRSQFQPLSPCEQDPMAEPFGNYAQVCTDNDLNSHLKYSDALDAMYTYNVGSRIMFMYDDEQGICRKVCNIKSRHWALQFGLAAYDLEYEDYSNNCSTRNRFGAFSRLKMVRKIVDYFRRSSGGGDCASDVPCANRR